MSALDDIIDGVPDDGEEITAVAAGATITG